jgi:hypothetical protein
MNQTQFTNNILSPPLQKPPTKRTLKGINPQRASKFVIAKTLGLMCFDAHFSFLSLFFHVHSNQKIISFSINILSFDIVSFNFIFKSKDSLNVNGTNRVVLSTFYRG